MLIKKTKARWLSGKLYQTFREEIITIPCKIFQKIEKRGILFNSFYEARVILIPKSGKDITRKENGRPNPI